ncbi:MAG: hypothetical protein J0I06_25920 [Planctomycetes bacterium]|nr:hypothetical protein [Planctomycetota bacterium]
MPSFKVPCPSCEAPVLIKNPDLVGKKVECPKCKYRFKVEAPAADADAAAAADAKDAKKGDAKDKEKEKDKKADGKKAKAAGGKNKKLVPILVGVGAVVVLAVVGFVAFGGSGKKGGGFVGSGGPPGGPKGGGSTGDGTDETGGPPPAKGGPVPEPIPFSKANTTNLLPGQAAAVYRFNMDRVRESPAHGALVDSQVRTLFRDSMGFELEEVETYLHCFAGADRAAFGVIKLKTPTKPADVAARLTLQPKPKAVKGRNLHAVRSNPFVNAVSHALAMRSLLGEVYDRLPAPPPAKANAQPLGLCVYDTQHVLIGDYALLEKFLGELDADGYPPFKTVMNTPTAAPPPPTMPGVPMGTPMGTAPTPPAPPAPAPAGAGGDKPFTSIDAYRTVEPPLKKALDAMEADKLRVPLVVYAEKFDSKQYDPAQMKESYSALKEALAPIAARTLYLSGNVVTFSQRQLVANLRITLPPGAAEDARTIAKDQLGPGLTTVAGLLKLSLTVPVEVRDYTKGGTATDAGIPGSPGMMGTGPYPGMFEGSPGPGMLPGGRPGVGAFPSGPGDMGPGPGKPGGFPGPGGPPAGLPGMSSFPPGMGEMGPGVTPGFEDPDRV